MFMGHIKSRVFLGVISFSKFCHVFIILANGRNLELQENSRVSQRLSHIDWFCKYAPYVLMSLETYVLLGRLINNSSATRALCIHFLSKRLD